MLEQLARGIARQVIGDDDLAGQLVAGELVGQVVPQLLDAELRTVDGGDERDDLLAPLGIGFGHDGDIGDALMGDDGLLDLEGVDVLTADDDDVLRPVDDEQEAVLIESGDVAGPIPLALEGRCGRFGIAEVLAHAGVAGEPDLTGLAGTRLGAVGLDHAHRIADHRRPPDRTRLAQLVLGPQQAAGGSHFAHAEEIVELIGPIGLDEHRRRGTVDRRTAVVPPADGREVVVGEVDAHLLRGHDRGDVGHGRAEEGGHGLLGDDRHRIDRMIGPLQDDGAPGLDRRQEADVERGRMPDRHADQVAVIAAVAHIEVDERGDLRDAAVGVHAALRRARRTRGVEDLGDLLIGEVAGHGLLGGLEPGIEAVGRVRLGLEPGDVRRTGPGGLGELGADDAQPGPGVVDRVRDLGRLHLVVDRHDGGPEVPGAEGGEDEAGDVEGHDAHDIAGAHPAVLEHAGGLERAAAQLCIGEALVAVDQRLLLRVTVDCRIEHRAELHCFSL